MKSLEARVAALEQEDAPPPPFPRELTDVERAVRVVHILTHPESPQHAGLVDLLAKQAETMPEPEPEAAPAPVPPAPLPTPQPNWRD